MVEAHTPGAPHRVVLAAQVHAEDVCVAKRVVERAEFCAGQHEIDQVARYAATLSARAEGKSRRFAPAVSGDPRHDAIGDAPSSHNHTFGGARVYCQSESAVARVRES